jgi:hypothetical protein
MTKLIHDHVDFACVVCFEDLLLHHLEKGQSNVKYHGTSFDKKQVPYSQLTF